MRGIGLRGVAVPEFKRDPRDGEWKLIEVNHRFTGSLDLTRHCGIDMARIAYDSTVGPVPAGRPAHHLHRQHLRLGSDPDVAPVPGRRADHGRDHGAVAGAVGGVVVAVVGVPAR